MCLKGAGHGVDSDSLLKYLTFFTFLLVCTFIFTFSRKPIADLLVPVHLGCVGWVLFLDREQEK